MSKETNVAAADVASEKSAKSDVKKDTKKDDTKGGAVVEKKKKFANPFTMKDPLQAKMVNCIMKNGKKQVAIRIVEMAFEEMNRRGEKDILKTFEKAISNTTPTMEVRPRRVGGSIYQIPVEVTPKRQASLSIRWILAAARSKKGQPMYRRLASELLDASNETGNAFRKREESHKMAQSNKAFAHLARY
jgi:small subunit ribosomal protein S7